MRASTAKVRGQAALLSCFALVIAIAVRADASSPVLHERIAPDPREDITFAVTTPKGELPAAMQTLSGVVRAPDTERAPGPEEPAYGASRGRTGPDATYRPDRDTRRPSALHYDDPFTPTITPYKRMQAFDAVAPGYTLRVRDPSLKRVPTYGSIADGEDGFFADFSVDLEPGEPARIPSLGPGARVLRMHATPEVPLDLMRDGADNWFVVSKQRNRVRLVMQVAVARATFGGQLALGPWAGLELPAPLPGQAAKAAARVADAIGIRSEMSPSEMVSRLAAYFRGFEPSDAPLPATDDVYLDLALSKKGVCRHRAFAFLVTALGLRIPTRMVTNEAHAWVEVGDGRHWQRIDLGGAATRLDEPEGDHERPAYAPPPDPLAWPTPESRAGSGQALADRAKREPSPASDVSSMSSAEETSSTPDGSSEPRPDDPRPRAEVSFNAPEAVARRGGPLHVVGAVRADDAACAHVRIDVKLAGPKGTVSAGALATDDDGRFDGSVSLPAGIAVGEYDIEVSTPGDARCGPGRAR